MERLNLRERTRFGLDEKKSNNLLVSEWRLLRSTLCWPCIKNECQKSLTLLIPPPQLKVGRFGTFKSGWTSAWKCHFLPVPPPPQMQSRHFRSDLQRDVPLTRGDLKVCHLPSSCCNLLSEQQTGAGKNSWWGSIQWLLQFHIFALSHCLRATYNQKFQQFNVNDWATCKFSSWMLWSNWYS